MDYFSMFFCFRLLIGLYKEEEKMKRIKRLCIGLLLCILMSTLAPKLTDCVSVEVSAASRFTGWKNSGTKRYYYLNGKKVTGQRKIGKYYYYFNPKGVLQKNKFIKIGNKKYYFISDGRRYTGKKKFKKIIGKYYWFNSKSQVSVKSGWQTISGNKYYLSKKGIPYTGYRKIGNYYYYFKSNGVMQKSKFIKVDKKNYYFSSNGRRYNGKNKLKKISGIYYWFDQNYSASVYTGWYKNGKDTMYLSTAGKLYTGYQKIDGDYYYFTESGKMLMDVIQKVNGSQFYFNKDGKRCNSKNEYMIIKGIYYWCNVKSELSLKEGIYKTSTKTIYINSKGYEQNGLICINGKYYYFENGLRTGFINLENNMYYFTEDGALTGWQVINGNRYHFGKNGKLSVNTTLDGYQIDHKGIATRITSEPTVSVSESLEVKTMTEEELLSAIQIDTEKAQKIFEKINEKRITSGMKPFIWNDRLLTGSGTMAGYNILSALKNPYTFTDTALHGRGQIGVGGMYLIPVDTCIELWMNSSIHKSSILTQSYGSAAVSYMTGTCKDKYGNNRIYTSVIVTFGPDAERDRKFTDAEVLSSMCSTVSNYMEKATVLKYKKWFVDPYIS